MKRRSLFSLSHQWLGTFNMGQLVPTGYVDALPGDTFQHGVRSVIRLSPMDRPQYSTSVCRTHVWRIPMRLLWEDWEKFITGGEDGKQTPAWPTIDATAGFAVGSLGDYLGFPVGINLGQVDAIPFRAYAFVFNRRYRVQQLVAEVGFSTASGVDATTNQQLLYAPWERDYFTLCTKEPLLGDPVVLPIGSTAPVEYVHANTDPWTVRRADTGAPVTEAATGVPTRTASQDELHDENTATDRPLHFDPKGNLQTNLAGATGVDLIEFRIAQAIQRYREARNLYGARLTEYIYHEFGVRSSDARLQEPEYLGGGKYPIQVSEIVQTAPTTGGSQDGVGNLSGHGLGVVSSPRYRVFFEEHCVVLTLMSVMPKTLYAQGVPRKYLKRVKEDLYQPELAHVGDEMVTNREIWAASATPDEKFGYQRRYEKYRREPSTIHGTFRDGGSGDTVWHQGRLFTSDPLLNGAFVTSDPAARIFQDTTGVQMQVLVKHSLQARRVVDKHGTAYLK